MPDLDYYLKLIPSQHSDKPRFVATVKARIEFYVRLQVFLQSMTAEFDLDGSVGVQLDQNGEWIGRTRHIGVPLAGVYFSWGVSGVGWEEGAWKGAYDPETALFSLHDDVYRRLLKAKIAANQWDGTIPGAYDVWDVAFKDSGSIFLIEDHQDMSMTVAIAGMPPDAVMRALLREEYLPLKPEGVRIRDYITTLSGDPIFSWGCDTETLNGWGVGYWPVSIAEYDFGGVDYQQPGYLRKDGNGNIRVREDVPVDMPDAIFGNDENGNIYVRDNVSSGSASALARADDFGNITLDANR